MVGKTDIIQYNKKINFDVHNKRRIILLKEICFPSAISVFFKSFRIKYYRNLSGSKYDSFMVTFNLCRLLIRVRSRPPRILAGIWFYLFHFEKWWVLKQMECVFWCEIALLFASFAFCRKCNAVCWRDIIIPRQRERATQWSYFTKIDFSIVTLFPLLR